MNKTKTHQIHVKGVPKKVKDFFKKKAALNKRSINNEILSLMETEYQVSTPTEEKKAK